MTGRCLIRRTALQYDSSEYLQISEGEFSSLKRNSSIISGIVDAEEAFEKIVLNFTDWERAFVEASFEILLRGGDLTSKMDDLRLNQSRVLQNFLSSVRHYLDYSMRILKKNEGEQAATTMKDFRGFMRHDCLEYRFFDALRNYSQHAGPPLHTMSFIEGWKYEKGKKGQGVTAIAMIDLGLLRQDTKFPKSLVSQIEEVEGGFDLKRAARVYFGKLTHVHSSFKNQTANSLQSALEERAKYVGQFSRHFDITDSLLTLAAVHYEGKEEVDKVWLKTRAVDRLNTLRSRNTEQHRFEYRFVSTEV